MDFCLLFTRLRDSYGRSARGGPCAIRNKRVLDAPSLAVTRRLLAAARIWIMMRAPLQDHRITIPPSYVKQLRAQFMRIFIDFVDGDEGDDYVRGKMSFPSFPAVHMQNIEILDCCPQLPAIVFPGGPIFHAFSPQLERPKLALHSDSD